MNAAYPPAIAELKANGALEAAVTDADPVLI
jgi:hypothetical protein